jgi:hypothetical protein
MLEQALAKFRDSSLNTTRKFGMDPAIAAVGGAPHTNPKRRPRAAVVPRETCGIILERRKGDRISLVPEELSVGAGS